MLSNQNFRGRALKSLTSVGLNKVLMGLGGPERDDFSLLQGMLNGFKPETEEPMRCLFGSLLRKLILGRAGGE